MGGSFANDGVGRKIFDTDTSRRAFSKPTASDKMMLDENNATRACVTTTAIAVNTSYVFGGAIQQSGNPNKEIYLNGASQGTENTDMTDTFGTYFWVGQSAATGSFGNGLYQGITTFNRVLTASEFLTVADLMGHD
jgi:hypothetical protein